MIKKILKYIFYIIIILLCFKVTAIVSAENYTELKDRSIPYVLTNTSGCMGLTDTEILAQYRNNNYPYYGIHYYYENGITGWQLKQFKNLNFRLQDSDYGSSRGGKRLWLHHLYSNNNESLVTNCINGSIDGPWQQFWDIPIDITSQDYFMLRDTNIDLAMIPTLYYAPYNYKIGNLYVNNINFFNIKNLLIPPINWTLNQNFNLVDNINGLNTNLKNISIKFDLTANIQDILFIIDYGNLNEEYIEDIFYSYKNYDGKIYFDFNKGNGGSTILDFYLKDLYAKGNYEFTINLSFDDLIPNEIINIKVLSDNYKSIILHYYDGYQSVDVTDLYGFYLAPKNWTNNLNWHMYYQGKNIRYNIYNRSMINQLPNLNDFTMSLLPIEVDFNKKSLGDFSNGNIYFFKNFYIPTKQEKSRLMGYSTIKYNPLYIQFVPINQKTDIGIIKDENNNDVILIPPFISENINDSFTDLLDNVKVFLKDKMKSINEINGYFMQVFNGLPQEFKNYGMIIFILVCIGLLILVIRS